ncbi:MAG: hypothetical protein E6Q24_01380 [Chitinophagaceae bacterium]|nr:MAG: hypothetical protein E6Q24_01380 [Chitinophagaceae bacterium]
MTQIATILHYFIISATEDSRISPAHISLFLAILLNYQDRGALPIEVSKKEIIKKAKISETTYHRCMRQLHAYGYIHYQPSFDPIKSNLVYINIDDASKCKL